MPGLWNVEDLTTIVSEDNDAFLLDMFSTFSSCETIMSEEKCFSSSICFQHCLAKVRDYGMVVVSREGSNPEKFIYNSDLLTKYRYFLF